MNPAWPVQLIGREKIRDDVDLRDGREPPVAARHPGAVPRLRALQVGLEDRELPHSADRLEHVAQPLHQAQARRPRERGPDDAGVPGDARERQLDHDVSGGHALAGRPPARLQDRRLRAGARRRARRSCRSSWRARPTRCPSGASSCRADTRSGSRSSTRCRPASFADESVDALTARMRELIASHLEPAEMDCERVSAADGGARGRRRPPSRARRGRRPGRRPGAPPPRPAARAARAWSIRSQARPACAVEPVLEPRELRLERGQQPRHPPPWSGAAPRRASMARCEASTSSRRRRTSNTRYCRVAEAKAPACGSASARSPRARGARRRRAPAAWPPPARSSRADCRGRRARTPSLAIGWPPAASICITSEVPERGTPVTIVSAASGSARMPFSVPEPATLAESRAASRSPVASLRAGCACARASRSSPGARPRPPPEQARVGTRRPP